MGGWLLVCVCVYECVCELGGPARSEMDGSWSDWIEAIAENYCLIRQAKKPNLEPCCWDASL